MRRLHGACGAKPGLGEHETIVAAEVVAALGADFGASAVACLIFIKGSVTWLS